LLGGGAALSFRPAMIAPIASIRVHVISAPLSEPFAFSQGWVHQRNSVLVEVRSRAGVTGWGECLCHGLQPPEIAAAILEHACIPNVLGRDAFDVEVLWEELYNRMRPYGQGGAVINALSGLDIALWDLIGRTLGQPVHKLIGGAFRERVEPYVTGFYRRRDGNYPADAIREAEAHLAAGFRALKLKTGFGVEQDIAYVRAMRAAVGPDVRLMIDANGAYSVAAARRVLLELAEARLYFFEEPVAPEDLEGYRQLRGLTATFIAGGENVLGKHACRPWIVGGGFDIFQPDICACGGFTEVKKIAALCQAWHLPIIPHVWGSGIGLAASLQLIASLPPTPLALAPIEPLLEYDCSDHPFRGALIHDAIARETDGFVPVPTGPGLGVEVNQEILARYRTRMVSS
jgi:D-galactarolactone cycloisomerase